MVEILKKAVAVMLQLLYPLRCPVCDEIAVPFGAKVCPSCIGRLKLITSPYCMKCGKQLKEQEQEYCHDCSTRKHYYVRGRALYEYGSAAASIYRFKYGGRKEYADFYGEQIAKQLKETLADMAPDLLIPIPLHPARKRKRGYNQAELLAKSISGYTGIPVCGTILVRVKNTAPLKRLNPQERENNLKKAFHIRGNDVKCKTILLVDDIYTTGSTIDAAARELLNAGAGRVYFIALSIGAGL